MADPEMQVNLQDPDIVSQFKNAYEKLYDGDVMRPMEDPAIADKVQKLI